MLELIEQRIREFQLRQKKQYFNQTYNKSHIYISNVIIVKKYGYQKLECRVKRSNKNCQANAIKGEGENSKILLLACNTGKNENKSIWFLDTYYSNHMCQERVIYKVG